MRLGADPRGAVTLAFDASGTLHRDGLTGTGLAVFLAGQCLAGNTWEPLFREAFSDDVLRTKVFSLEDQALLSAVDAFLGMYGADSFGGRGEPDELGRRTRLPMDVQQRCARAASAVAGAALPVYASLQTLLSRFGTPVSTRIQLAGPVTVPLGIPSSQVALELSGPWNRRPAAPQLPASDAARGDDPVDGAPASSRATAATFSGLATGGGGTDVVSRAELLSHRRALLAHRSERRATARRRRMEPSLLSRLLEVTIAGQGWSLHRINTEDLEAARFADGIGVEAPGRADDHGAPGPDGAEAMRSTRQSRRGVWSPAASRSSPAGAFSPHGAGGKLPPALVEAGEDPFAVLPSGVGKRLALAAGISGPSALRLDTSGTAGAFLDAELRIAVARRPAQVAALRATLAERAAEAGRARAERA